MQRFNRFRQLRIPTPDESRYKVKKYWGIVQTTILILSIPAFPILLELVPARLQDNDSLSARTFELKGQSQRAPAQNAEYSRAPLVIEPTDRPLMIEPGEADDASQ